MDEAWGQVVAMGGMLVLGPVVGGGWLSLFFAFLFSLSCSCLLLRLLSSHPYSPYCPNQNLTSPQARNPLITLPIQSACFSAPILGLALTSATSFLNMLGIMPRTLVPSGLGAQYLFRGVRCIRGASMRALVLEARLFVVAWGMRLVAKKATKSAPTTVGAVRGLGRWVKRMKGDREVKQGLGEWEVVQREQERKGFLQLAGAGRGIISRMNGKKDSEKGGARGVGRMGGRWVRGPKSG